MCSNCRRPPEYNSSIRQISTLRFAKLTPRTAGKYRLFLHNAAFNRVFPEIMISQHSRHNGQKELLGR
jgi:hypothetical protein